MGRRTARTGCQYVTHRPPLNLYGQYVLSCAGIAARSLASVPRPAPCSACAKTKKPSKRMRYILYTERSSACAVYERLRTTYIYSYTIILHAYILYLHTVYTYTYTSIVAPQAPCGSSSWPHSSLIPPILACRFGSNQRVCGVSRFADLVPTK